jgi:hypothetical protein
MRWIIIPAVAVIALAASVQSSNAANWVYYGREAGGSDLYNALFPPANDYIDADSVSRNGDTLTVWQKKDYDQVEQDGTKTILVETELNLSAKQEREILVIRYNSDGQEISRDNGASGWRDYAAGDNFDQFTSFALRYAH